MSEYMRDALRFSLQREFEAMAFYEAALGRVRDPEARAALEFLSREEKRHLSELSERFAREHGRAVRELALTWLAAQPQVSSVLVGATRPQQVEENVCALDWRLTADDLAQLDTALTSAAPKPPAEA